MINIYSNFTKKELVKMLVDLAHHTSDVQSSLMSLHFDAIEGLKKEILKRDAESDDVQYVQEKVNDYIVTYSGSKFYVTEPKSEDVLIEDIAHALSHSTRFTGHTREKFYSVGEHSLYCANIAKEMGFSYRIQFLALMHDASEAYCADVNRPLKQHLNDYKKAEDKIMDAIWKSYNIQPTEEEYAIIKLIDNTMLLAEMKQLMYRAYDELPDVECIKSFVDYDLTRKYTMKEVEEGFLDTFTHLYGTLNELNNMKVWGGTI